MDPKVIAELAPTGVLRAGINLSNFLLVSGRDTRNEPQGVSPDIAAEIARRLGVPVQYITFEGPGQLADQAGQNVWDIGLIGAEPQRAKTIAFTPAYAQIEATYLVPAHSPIQSIDEVDKAGVRIAVTGRAAYGLWLARNVQQASLMTADSLDASYDIFVANDYEALAGLRPRLLTDQQRLPGSRILDGYFSTVQQAIGTAPGNEAAIAFLRGVVADIKASGFVAQRIAHHRVEGLAVAGD